MDVQVSIDDEWAKKLKKQIGIENSTELTRVAFTIFAWVVNEVEEGRVVLSRDGEGLEYRQLSMNALDAVKRKT